MRIDYAWQIQFAASLRSHQPMCRSCAEFIASHFIVKHKRVTDQRTDVRPVEPEIRQAHFFMQYYDPRTCWECGGEIDTEKKGVSVR